MVRTCLLFSFFLFASLLLGQQPRFALVVGNGDYEFASLGQTPINDAMAVRDALTLAGFAVDYYTNLNQSKLSTAITAFGRKIKDSGGVALFYYSGHGVQHNNTNYLVPIGAEMTDEEDIEGLCVPIGRITSRMLSAGTVTNIVVLDACRAFPMSRGTKSLTQGLAKEDYAVPELLVAYATAPGSTATVRGENGLSLYTSQLLKHLKTPGLVLENVLKNTRRDVIAKSNGQQRPDQSGILSSDFYFFAATESVQKDTEPTVPEQPITRPTGSGSLGGVDSDLDGTPDASDPCPNDYGALAANGCPDYDEDGVPNSVDKCPNSAGKKAWQGCPDSDEDGVPDHEDRCPFEPGVFADHGCLPPNADRDGDGIVNSKDKCPSVKGILENGCPQVPFVKSHTVQPGETLRSLSKTYNLIVPEIAQANSLRNDDTLEPGKKLFIPVTELDLDSDNDGTPDWKDFCPKEKGTVANKGCPEVPSNMALVRGGTYMMGGGGYTDEKPHSVTLSDFYIGKFEVTFEEYDAFCNATGREKPEDSDWGRGRRPVINVDWYDAVEYCNWRSQQENLAPVYSIDKSRKDPNNLDSNDDEKWTIFVNSTAKGYRLPTEAEWEYAAREGGKKVRFGNGRDIINPSEINFDASASHKNEYSVVGDCREKTVPVDDLSANSLGLKHMSGNVWEWCSDWYVEKYYSESGVARNPDGPISGSSRVVRGGSFEDEPFACQATYRFNWMPWNGANFIGFRVVRPL